MPEQNSKHVADHESHLSIIREAMAADFFYATGRQMPGQGRHAC